MPHVREFHANSAHADHDPLVVAALAAGDLSGTDRDHALVLTRSCASCGLLHDDLVAIALATATVPPIAARPRDFQLTAADAVRLRPAAWRRLLGGIAGAPRAVTRPLGVGLATLGLVGLIVGNVPILTSGQAARPTSGAAAGAPMTEQSAASAAPSAGDLAANPLTQPGATMADSAASAAAASTGTEFGTAAGASPSSAASSYGRNSSASSQPTRVAANPATKSTSGEATTEPLSVTTGETGATVGDTPSNPLNALFALAVIAGLGLLVLSRLRGRSAG